MLGLLIVPVCCAREKARLTSLLTALRNIHPIKSVCWALNMFPAQFQAPEIFPLWIQRLQKHFPDRSHWPRGLRHRSTAGRLFWLWIRIPPEAWMFVCCECCALSGRGLCDGLISRLEESYRLWCVVLCDLETSWMRRHWPTGGLLRQNKQTIN